MASFRLVLWDMVSALLDEQIEETREAEHHVLWWGKFKAQEGSAAAGGWTDDRAVD